MRTGPHPRTAAAVPIAMTNGIGRPTCRATTTTKCATSGLWNEQIKELLELPTILEGEDDLEGQDDQVVVQGQPPLAPVTLTPITGTEKVSCRWCVRQKMADRLNGARVIAARRYGQHGCPRCGNATFCHRHNACVLCGDSPCPVDGKQVPIAVVATADRDVFDVKVGDDIRGQIKRWRDRSKRGWTCRVFPDAEWDDMADARWIAIRLVVEGRTRTSGWCTCVKS